MSIQSLLEKMHYVTKARMRVYSFMYSMFDYLFSYDKIHFRIADLLFASQFFFFWKEGGRTRQVCIFSGQNGGRSVFRFLHYDWQGRSSDGGDL